MSNTATSIAHSAYGAHGIWAPGVVLMRNLRFTSKAILISLAFLLPVLGTLGWLLYDEENQLYRSRQDATRQHVEVAHGVLQWAYEQEKSGALTREQAQASAKAAVSKLRYDQQEYFWINDMEPRVVMHPINTKLDGQMVADVKDPTGFFLFRGFVDQVRREGKGFVPYMWPKPGSEKPVEKISYVMGFEPWGWVIGSGIYLDDLRQATQKRLQIAAIVVVIGLLIPAYFFVAFFRVNRGGLQVISQHLDQLSHGDLRHCPEKPWGHDEPAQLIVNMQNLYRSLNHLITRVRHGATELQTASREISSASTDLSARTEASAAALEQQASAMEQMNSTVAATASTVSQAAKFAADNAKTAQRGGEVINEVVGTMEGIHASSAKINDIIGVIDGIAFQTNILALNAAVEAARAGEQGRGFAVVASEVRQLAQRSAGAAKEIKDLITTSVEQIGGGTKIVREAGSTMNELVSNAEHISRLLADVATASREQSIGVEQVDRSVQELDRSTQQNAALAEQTTAAAESLKRQAELLHQEISNFQVA